MKKILLIATVSMYLYSNAAISSTIFTIEGTISQLGYYSSTDTVLLQYYTDTYGISVGDTMRFEVEVDFTRQGEITNADGSITTYTDVPLTRNCDACYGYSGTQYDYAALLSSSFDFSSFSTGQYYNVATSDYSEGMATDSHTGKIELSNLLTLYAFNTLTVSDLVYNWSQSMLLSATIDLDDGSGAVSYYGGSFSITNIQVVPVPGAFWLFGSGILGLLGMMRKKH